MDECRIQTDILVRTRQTPVRKNCLFSTLLFSPMKSHPFTYQDAERFFLRLLNGLQPPSRPHIRQLHAFLFRHRVYDSNLILSHFIARFPGDSGRIPYACRIFNHAHKPNILLFNSMIKLHSLHPVQASGSFDFYDVMRARSIFPDEFTFAPLLKSCNAVSDVVVGKCVHGQVTVGGYQSFKAVRIGIVELYAEYGEMGDAQKAFEEMGERDSAVVCNIMVNGFLRASDLDTGLRFFRGIGNRNIVSWNTVISCLGKHGRYSEAMDVFREMVSEEGFSMDEVTVVSMLPVCAKLGDVTVGDWVKGYAEKKGILEEFQSARNAVVDFYCKCGDMDKALDFFWSMSERNEVTWNAMITGMAYNGKELQGVELFEEMVKDGVTPNSSSFVGVLTCCSHAGLIDRARALFASMQNDYKIEPKLEHYGCMVDLLGRSGCIGEAFDLIRVMPLKANTAMWGSLLSACRMHREVELAVDAVKELIRLEPSNSGNYVLLSNLYAETGKWVAVEVVRESMRENSIRKEPGRSAVGS